MSTRINNNPDGPLLIKQKPYRPHLIQTGFILKNISKFYVKFPIVFLFFYMTEPHL